MARPQSKERVIYPGDMVRITCDEPELCVERMVNPDGMILLPIVGPLGVATLTSSQVATKIQGLVDRPMGVLNVSTEYLEGEPIEILGAVKHALKLRFSRSVSLISLVRTASPTELADTSTIEISHADGTFVVVDLETGTSLVDGDRITVPIASGSHSVEIVGGVEKPIHLDLRGKLSISEALTAAGGIAARGDSGRITVFRLGETIPIRLPEDQKFQLSAGDQLRVEAKEPLDHVLVQGNVVKPGLTDFRPGMTLTGALRAAGGVNEFNRSDLVCLRQVVNGTPHTVKLSLRFLFSHRILDPILSVGDSIEVGTVSKDKSR